MAALDRKHLRECLDAFSDCTGVPVTLFTPEGDILEELRPNEKFCRFFSIYRDRDSECMQTLSLSMDLSYTMGEPYIFYCPAGLTHIAVPVLENGHFTACAVAGPLAMTDVDDRMLSHVLTMSPELSSRIAEIALFASKMQRFPPARVQHLSTLLYSSIVFALNSREDYVQQNSRHQLHLDIGRQIHSRKNNVFTENLSYSQLRDVYISALWNHDTENALRYVNRMIEELILVDGNFDTVKMQFLDLFVSTIHMAAERGIPLRSIFSSDRDSDVLTALAGVDSVDELSAWARSFTEFFCASVLPGTAALSPVIAKALAYLSEHYMEKLTLRELAASQFVSESYLSKLFRQELNTSFTDYLNKLRIERSMELMNDSELSLLDISGQVGFEDQSYFTKVFKRVTGKTPRQYKTTGKGEFI